MADEKVLAAQKWVNATYGSVTGYVKCPENGQTGWATMYSLTMGLQHELGISPVVASFGAGTLSKLVAYGNVGPNDPKKNIVTIIKHALFCKGYWGDNGSGSFSAESLVAMKSDMGLASASDPGVVQPKVFKALLTMDSYVLLSGGSDKVRGIQKWLNGRYLGKSTFYLGPCDGHYSRDVQQALMKAIQYELGIPEDQATGNFGAGTQAGLKNHTVSVGSNDIFVKLFSAACVFNEPVVYAGNSYVTSFKEDGFDSKLADFVKAFQRFSMLDPSGVGNYQTWAQLLVSTGDPERAVQACDTRFTITASRAKALYNAGYRYVGRYLYDPPGSTLDKEIKPGELQDIFTSGLRVFPIYQDNARKLADFTFSQGYQHGHNAHNLAVQYGFNRSTVIYFAVDYDATSEEIASNIVPYFRGVNAALANKGKRYVHGVYGSRNVCAKVTKETYARYSFVSGMSWGFSGNLGFPLPVNWAFNQIKEFKYAAGGDVFDLDNDAHREGADSGQNSVNKPVTSADDFISYIDKLYGLAVSYGKGDPNRLVMEYVRHNAYGDDNWWALIGDPDRSFVEYAENHGVGLYDEFKDPYTGHTIGAEHLMATANAHFVKKQPADIINAGAGDVGGWGGDIMTLYGEWRRDSDSYPSGRNYVMDKFAKIGVDSTFAYKDLLEDSDGYLIAERVRDGKTIVQAVTDHYRGTGGLSRFRDYYLQRFGGTQSLASDTARMMLITEKDPVITLGRNSLIWGIAGYATLLPAMLPNDKLTEFVNAFGESLASRAKLEGGMKATLLANQKKNLRSR